MANYYFLGAMKGVFVFVIFIGLISLSYGEIGDMCTTPLGETDECIPITQCDSLYYILMARPITLTNMDLLRKFQCGFEGSTPTVCCFGGPTPFSTTPSTNLEPDPLELDLLPGTDVCGISIENRIVGGQNADLDEIPWMALIEYQGPYGNTGFYCIGVLINSKYVLTAAHCLIGKDLPITWKIISVRLGEYNIGTDVDCIRPKEGPVECAPPVVNVAVDERIAHESYNPFDQNYYHDIALLRLTTDVRFSDFIKPICLPRSPILLSQSYTNKYLYVAGWNKTEDASESNIKVKLTVPVNTPNVCTRTDSPANIQLSNGQLCVGNKNDRDLCMGYSGGPLMTVAASENYSVNWYSVGVLSSGAFLCGTNDSPRVFTKVANYVPWIISKLKP